MTEATDIRGGETMMEVISAPGLKAILLYTKAAGINAAGLKLLTDAGYVPIKVASPEDVKLLALQVTHQVAPSDMGTILRAALTAINQYGDGPPQQFGKALAKMLLAQQAAP
jgi:hypothetical protein